MEVSSCDCPTLSTFPFSGSGMCLYFHDEQPLKPLQNTDITEVRGNRTRLISILLPCVLVHACGPNLAFSLHTFYSFLSGLACVLQILAPGKKKTTRQRFMNQFSQMLQVKSL